MTVGTCKLTILDWHRIRQCSEYTESRLFVAKNTAIAWLIEYTHAEPQIFLTWGKAPKAQHVAHCAGCTPQCTLPNLHINVPFVPFAPQTTDFAHCLLQTVRFAHCIHHTLHAHLAQFALITLHKGPFFVHKTMGPRPPPTIQFFK